MSMMDRATFQKLASNGNVIAMVRRLMSDQLTPVLAYRRLVAPDERTAPSFLLESVEGGSSVGRYSFVGAQPSVEAIAKTHEVHVIDHRAGRTMKSTQADPLAIPRSLTAGWQVACDPQIGTRRFFTGGWVGYAGYDTVRYLE